MQKIKTLGFFFLIITLLLTFAPQISSAQSPAVNKGNRMEKLDSICDKITKAIQGRVTSAKARITARETFVANRKTQLSNLIKRLQDRGANVTKLQSDQVQFASLLDKWLSDYKIYVQDLENAQNISCGSARAQFRQALDTAKKQHQLVLQDRQAFKDFVKNSLRPDIKAVRNTIKTTPTP